MQIRSILPGAIFLFVLSCSNAQKSGKPVEKNITPETDHLYQYLKQIQGRKILFGHQDDMAYGVGWKYEEGRSDIKDVTGGYPSVFGWELGRLEIDSPLNLDGVPFDKMKHFISEGYKNNCIITISWHLNNPLTGKTAWDPAAGTVASILPGGNKNSLYISWLDKVAEFLEDLKDSNGTYIPVIFRPFHELNGNWFWWGKDHCTPEEFKKLWRFTVGYLRNEKKLKHILYAFNTDKFYSKDEFLERYPGDEWVDIIGFDIYQRELDKETYQNRLDKMLTDLESIAAEKNKVAALTEFGGNIHADSTWWTGTFLPVLKKHKIAYVLGWRNAGQKSNGEFEYYVPYKGQLTEKDFIDFYNDGFVLFSSAMKNERVY